MAEIKFASLGGSLRGCEASKHHFELLTIQINKVWETMLICRNCGAQLSFD